MTGGGITAPIGEPPVSSALAPVVVDQPIRCAGIWRGKTCNMMAMEYAARPWRFTCERCGHVNERR